MKSYTSTYLLKDKPGNKHVCFLQAIMEEADIQIAETKKASYEFNRDIVQGSVNTVCLLLFLVYISCLLSFKICIVNILSL